MPTIVSPFIAGQFADRYFSTERILSFLVITGGIVKWYTATRTDYESWLWLSILYSVLYMPTLALSNSVAFSHIDDAENTFPKIRVWGTIGWIAASWAFPMIWLQQNLSFQLMPPFLSGDEVPNVTARLADALKFSGIISMAYGAFCFLLPNTPPKADAVEKLAFKKAFKELFLKITSSSDHKIINTINMGSIKALVDSFTITEEKFVNENYTKKS